MSDVEKGMVVALEEVKRVIQNSVEPNLDLSSKECECCGLNNYNNFTHYRVSLDMNGILGRIENAIRKLKEEEDG